VTHLQSLVIEEMVVKPSPPPPRSTSELERESPSLADYRVEEQTLAKLSSANWWVKQKALLRRVKLAPKTNRSLAARPSARAIGLSSVHSLSVDIDFDVSNRQPSGSGGSGGGAVEPPPSSPSNRTEPAAGGGQQQQPPQGDGTSGGLDTDQSAPAAAPEGDPKPADLLNWSKEGKKHLLGAFFLGYVIFQVPAGRAAELFGPKLLLLWLGLGTGLSSLVFPYAARYSDDSILLPYLIRVLMGASQAGLFPASYVLLCNWLPESERSSWLAVPSAMGRLGTIAMNLVVPIIMFHYNWEWVFYASGLVTLAWTLLMLVFGADRPASSWWLSREEFIHIHTRIGPEQQSTVGAKQSTDNNELGASWPTLSLDGSTTTLDKSAKRPTGKPAKPTIDWLKMLTSRAVIIMTVVMFSSEWSNMLLLVTLPCFLGPALGMSLDEIGHWSSALVLIYCVMYPVSGVLAGRLEACQLAGLNSLRIRKLFEAMAQLLQAAGCLTIATFNDKTIVLCALVAIMLGRSLVGGGQCLMPPELSKDYPGSVLALSNSVANCAGFLGPMVLSKLVTEPTEYGSWRIMWLLSAGLFLLSGLLFCCFADNRPQNFTRKPKLKKSRSVSNLDDLALPVYLPPPQAPKRARGDRQQQPTTTSTRRLWPSEPAAGAAVAGAEDGIRLGSFSRVSSGQAE
jgi:MFS family permease